MNNKVVLSVIIPAYNVEKYLSKCLATVLCYDKAIQYILVNDGSTDDTLIIAKQFQKKYGNLKIINQKNQGLSVARNSGIKEATGEWLYFVDSDDYVDSGFIKKIFNLIKVNNKCDLISLPVIRISNNGAKKIMQDYGSTLSRSEYIKLLILGKRQFGVWSCIFKKSLIDKYNIRFKKNKLFEDQYFVPLYLAYIKKVFHFCSRDVGFYYYRFRNGSITNSNLSEEKINEKLEAEWFRDDYLWKIVDSDKVQRLINTNRLTLLYRAYINFIKIKDITDAKKIKKRYFGILVNDQLMFRWKESIKTIIMLFPVNIISKRI